jgi:hypothetical protein
VIRLAALPLLSGLALAACTPVPAQEDAPPAVVAGGGGCESMPMPPEGVQMNAAQAACASGQTLRMCVADGLTGLTGKTRSEAVASEALRRSGARNIRWISPGMAVTMDFRSDRLNLELDAQGKIVRAHCG